MLLERILIRKKVLWRINFILIKFSLNALLFEKSWNECKNPSFLHKTMCIQSDHGSMKMWHCLSTFTTLYCMGLWLTRCAQSNCCGFVSEILALSASAHLAFLQNRNTVAFLQEDMCIFVGWIFTFTHVLRECTMANQILCLYTSE